MYSFFSEPSAAQHNKVALRDLKKLLLLCKEPHHVKYALKGVEYFQLKGNDFSEEVCTLFVRTCVMCGNPETAANEFLKQNHRIGAWLTQASFKVLIESMREKCQAKLLVEVLEMVVKKGFRPSQLTMDYLWQFYQHGTDSNVHARFVAVAEKFATIKEFCDVDSNNQR